MSGYPYDTTDTGDSETYTRSYSAGLPLSSWWNSEWGRPPFIPVSIVAGKEKLAVSTTTSGGSGSGTSGGITAAPSGTMKTSGASQTASGSSAGTTSTLKSGGGRLTTTGAKFMSGFLVFWLFGFVIL
jgi:hypothetical protein